MGTKNNIDNINNVNDIQNLKSIKSASNKEHTAIDRILKHNYEPYLFKYMNKGQDNEDVVVALYKENMINLTLYEVNVYRKFIFNDLSPSQKQTMRKALYEVTKRKPLGDDIFRDLSTHDYIDKLLETLEQELINLQVTKKGDRGDKYVDEMIKIIKQLTDMKIKLEKLDIHIEYMPIVQEVMKDVSILITRVIKTYVFNSNEQTRILGSLKEGFTDIINKYMKEYGEESTDVG